jgi:hypothetical protein
MKAAPSRIQIQLFDSQAMALSYACGMAQTKLLQAVPSRLVKVRPNFGRSGVRPF